MGKNEDTGALRTTLITLVVLLVGVFLVGFVSAEKTTYTPTTTTVCDDDEVCNAVLYSGVQNVMEDGKWVDVYKAKSLKDTGAYEVKFLETDGDYPLTVLDYNMTSITLDLDHWSFFNDAIDIRIWKSNDEKEKKYKDDVAQGLIEESGLESSYKSLFDKVSHEKEVFNLFDLGDKKVTYSISPGDIIEFGPNSTTIVLQTADSENLEDTFITEDAPTTNYGSEPYGLVGGDYGRNYTSMIKFNISSVPEGATIDSAILQTYIYGVFLDGSPPIDVGDSIKINAQHLYNSYDWVETTPTWNTKPSSSDYNTTESFNIFTNTSAVGWYNYNIDEMLVTQRSGVYKDNLSIYITSSEWNNINFSDTIYWRGKEYATTSLRPILNITYQISYPNATITYPINGTTYNISVNYFNWTFMNTSALDVCQYSINGTVNVSVTCTDLYKVISLDDGDYDILFTLNDTKGNMNWTQNFFTQDTTAPVINVTYPYETITNETIGHTLYFNWTATDATSSLSSCWYNYNNTNTTVTCGDQNTTFVTNLDGQRNLTFYVNDSLNNVADFTRYWDYKFLERSRTFNATSYETTTDNYILNISSDGTQVISAQLWYNNTNYTATKVGNNVEMTFTSEISHPWGETGNQTFYWTVQHGSDLINSTADGQYINPLQFGICNDTLVTPFINFTFKDEETDTFINSTFEVYDWFYYVGDGSQNKTFDYVNTTEQESYAFCFNTNVTVHNNASIKYKNSLHPERIYAQSVDLTNDTTYVVLYLLGSADGQYVSFRTQDQYGTIITGAQVQIEKEFTGAWVFLGQDLTDSSGSATFFLNPDDDHRITVTKSGYTPDISIIRPTQSSYTVVLTSAATYDTSARWEGIKYVTTPKTGTILAPNTSYDFGFNVTGILGNITACKLIITNTSFHEIGSAEGCGAYGGNITLNLGTNDNLKLFGNYYIDFGSGYQLLKSNDAWMVEMMNISSSGAYVWELMEKFTDYEGFGTGNKAEFNKITFFFILLVIGLGLFTKSTGIELTSPGYTMLILWGIITMFSFVGLFAVEGIIRNAWANKYAIWLMTSFLTWGFMLNYWRRNTT